MPSKRSLLATGKIYTKSPVRQGSVGCWWQLTSPPIPFTKSARRATFCCGEGSMPPWRRNLFEKKPRFFWSPAPRWVAAACRSQVQQIDGPGRLRLGCSPAPGRWRPGRRQAESEGATRGYGQTGTCSHCRLAGPRRVPHRSEHRVRAPDPAGGARPPRGFGRRCCALAHRPVPRAMGCSPGPSSFLRLGAGHCSGSIQASWCSGRRAGGMRAHRQPCGLPRRSRVPARRSGAREITPLRSAFVNPR